MQNNVQKTTIGKFPVMFNFVRFEKDGNLFVALAPLSQVLPLCTLQNLLGKTSANNGGVLVFGKDGIHRHIDEVQDLLRQSLRIAPTATDRERIRVVSKELAAAQRRFHPETIKDSTPKGAGNCSCCNCGGESAPVDTEAPEPMESDPVKLILTFLKKSEEVPCVDYHPEDDSSPEDPLLEDIFSSVFGINKGSSRDTDREDTDHQEEPSTLDNGLPGVVLPEDPTTEFVTADEFVATKGIPLSVQTLTQFRQFCSQLYQRERGHAPLRRKTGKTSWANCYPKSDYPLLEFAWDITTRGEVK